MSEQVTVRCDLIGLFSEPESMAIFLIQTVRKLTWAFLLTEVHFSNLGGMLKVKESHLKQELGQLLLSIWIRALRMRRSTLRRGQGTRTI